MAIKNGLTVDSYRRVVKSVVKAKNMLQPYVKCANIVMGYSTNLSLHVSITSKKLFASTMDNKNSSILGIQIVCKAAPTIGEGENTEL